MINERRRRRPRRILTRAHLSTARLRQQLVSRALGWICILRRFRTLVRFSSKVATGRLNFIKCFLNQKMSINESTWRCKCVFGILTCTIRKYVGTVVFFCRFLKNSKSSEIWLNTVWENGLGIWGIFTWHLSNTIEIECVIIYSGYQIQSRNCNAIFIVIVLERQWRIYGWGEEFGFRLSPEP